MRHDIKQAGREVLIRLMSALGIGEPYPWQHEVLEAFCLGTVPGAIQVPTGAGKTAVMVCWLSALIAQAKHGKVILPRRYTGESVFREPKVGWPHTQNKRCL